MTTEKKWNLPYAIEALTVHRDSRGALYEALRFSSQAIPLGGHGSKIFLFKTTATILFYLRKMFFIQKIIVQSFL